MDLGSSFALFFVIALVLSLLFCLLLKWNAYLMKRKRKQAVQRLQTLQRTHESVYNHDYEGEYDQYCQRKQQKKEELDQKLLQEELILDYPLKRQIFKVSNDLYGLSSLRQRLNNSLSSHDPYAFHHQMIPLKQMSFKKLNTMQTKIDSSSERNFKEYIKRLICYQKSGITLVEVQNHTLKKEGENLILKKKVQQTLIQANEPELENFLQSLGLQPQFYGCSKIVYQVDTSELKNNSTCTLKSLVIRQLKLIISKQEYLELLKGLKRE